MLPRHCRAVAFSIVLLLAACEGLPPEYYTAGGQPGTYQVRKGDTLYSIAFRYGLDYKSLARINGIGPPYLIYVNQVIRLKGSARLPQADQGPTGSTAKKSSVTPAKPMPPVPSAPVSTWQWPLKGEVIRPFSLTNPVNKGIDIAGKQGQSVLAAADGVVVYAGGNLRGYGKLVIVKHNDNFLSAYGNNEVMLVSEGDKVRRGAVIARVGSSAGSEGMLHFEIRRDGKPVDPLNYLVKR